MEPVDFLFALLIRFTKMGTEKASMLKLKMMSWISTKIFPKDEKGNPIEVTGIYKVIATHWNEWYTQVILAVIYIPLSIYINDRINAYRHGDDDDDDDDDGGRI